MESRWRRNAECRCCHDFAYVVERELFDGERSKTVLEALCAASGHGTGAGYTQYRLSDDGTFECTDRKWTEWETEKKETGQVNGNGTRAVVEREIGHNEKFKTSKIF